ncbi:MAG: hypothetical protein HOQ09_15100 [Gemmatimonadaceae bacterium]|nr:hypothetical protein [Gemmatimonadaceae bacterium]
MRERARPRGLALPIAISALLHVGIATTLLLARPKSAPARPPVYKVNIVAAPPGPRRIVAVTPTPPAQTPPPDAKPPARADVTPPAPVLPPK